MFNNNAILDDQALHEFGAFVFERINTLLPDGLVRRSEAWTVHADGQELRMLVFICPRDQRAQTYKSADALDAEIQFFKDGDEKAHASITVDNKCIKEVLRKGEPFDDFHRFGVRNYVQTRLLAVHAALENKSLERKICKLG